MRFRHPLRNAALLALACALPYFPACSSDKKAATEDTGNPALADVVYVGGTTDEALDQLLSVTPLDWAWAGGAFTSPKAGAVLPAGTPATFNWHVDSSSPTNGAGGAAGATGWLAPAPGATERLSRLLQAFGPERSAWAHGAPLNGSAFFLVFSSPSSPQLLRVFTDKTSYTPDAADWQKLVAAQATITLSVTSAVFENNLLTADGGPFTGQTLTFTIQ